MISDTDKAYIAGLFDGEGCVQFHRRYRARRGRKGKRYYCLTCTLDISMTDKHTIATRNSASQLIAWPSAIICLSMFSIRFNLRFTCFAEVYYFVLAMQAACLHC